MASAVGALLSVLVFNPAKAADLPDRPPDLDPRAPAVLNSPAPVPFISEVRGGVLYHEDSRLRRLLFNQDKFREHGYADVSGEVIFNSANWKFDNAIFDFVFNPRPHIGGSLNTGRGTSSAYAGFVWTYYFATNYFFEASLDVAFHNGFTGTGVPPDNLRNLGCNPLSRQSFWLGRNFGEHWRVMAGIEHLDNFHLCNNDQGLSNLGVRVGYRF